MIVKDIATFKKHVTCGFDFEFDLIAPYIKTQERKHIKSVIGSELYATWEVAPTAETPKLVHELLQEASSNFAMLTYTHVGVVHISNAGFSISNNPNSIPAGWGQLKDLRRQLLKTANEALDEALEIMEANAALFPTWITSQGYTDFKGFFVSKTQDFQKYYNIENSRLTFLRLKPHLLKVEDKYFEALLGPETVTIIKAAALDPAKAALKLARAAQVALCVAELAYEGAFAITPNGLVITSEELPGENYNRLAEKELYNFHRAKLEDGNEYLRKLVTHLNNNEETFPEFASKTTAAAPQLAYNKGGIVSF